MVLFSLSIFFSHTHTHTHTHTDPFVVGVLPHRVLLHRATVRVAPDRYVRAGLPDVWLDFPDARAAAGQPALRAKLRVREHPDNGAGVAVFRLLRAAARRQRAGAAPALRVVRAVRVRGCRARDLRLRSAGSRLPGGVLLLPSAETLSAVCLNAGSGLRVRSASAGRVDRAADGCGVPELAAKNQTGLNRNRAGWGGWSVISWQNVVYSS